jgi:hypothetical protein
MTANHPYPKHVVEAVAKALWRTTDGSFVMEWADLTDTVRNHQYTKANTALTALWEADQPHKLSADEARTIWSHAVNAHRGSTEDMHALRLLLAQHAPEWGNHDR